MRRWLGTDGTSRTLAAAGTVTGVAVTRGTAAAAAEGGVVAAPTPGVEQRGPRVDQKVAVATVFVAVMFMNIMDATIVNTALPTLGREFHVAPADVSGVAIGYLVSLAVFIPASGWLGDRVGPKRVLLGATALFTVASALCGAAGSFGELVAFRVLQGVGGGMMAPVGMALLYRTFPPAERVRASAVLTIPTTFAPALGPVLGGVLVTDLSWRWVFYVNLPIGLAAIAFGAAFLAPVGAGDPGRFDVPGFALAGVGLGALMYGVSEGPVRGWGDAGVAVGLVVGVAALAALVVVELRTPAPLVDLRLLADRLYRSATVVLLLGSIAFLGSLYTVALLFQDGRGLSALGSGLSTFPEALGVMAGAQLASRLLYPRVGPRRVMVGGLVGVAVTCALLGQIGAGTDLWWARLVLVGLGLAMAQVFVPAQAAAFATISPAATARASMLFNASRQTGAAVGVAALSTVLAEVGIVTHRGHAVVAHFAAYHWAFRLAAVVALAGAAVATTVHDDDAAATRPGH